MSSRSLKSMRANAKKKQQQKLRLVEAVEPRILMAAVPTFDHVVIVVEENHASGEILGNTQAPYINGLATTGALFTNSFAVDHPSQPNYLALFSGSTQGSTD